MSDETKSVRKGDYEILGVLGAGGMGKVYKVRNVLSDRVEAMKILLPDLSEQKELVDRFLIEIKVLAALHHPNIAELRTALTIDNQLVMIMEFVDGASLAHRVAQGPIPAKDALPCVDQVLAALGYAHKQGVVHRDIKPANMMVTPAGVVKLMDFGIARSGASSGLTMTGTTLGSVAYMSPEQVKCEPIDSRSDLYSVGVSLYEMVTGQKPFVDENNFAVMKAHIEQPPRPPIELQPNMSPVLNQLILMAMAKDPAQRFQTAEAFRGALRSVAPDLGPVAEVPQAYAPAATLVATPVPASVRTIPLTPAPSAAAGAPTIPTPVPGAAHTPAPAAPLAASAAAASAAYAKTIPTPVPVAHAAPAYSPAAAPPAQRDKRGLYITIGALVVVAVLVLAGIGLPKWLNAHAGSGSHATNPSPSAAPAPKPATAATVTPAAPPPSPAATPAPTPAPVAAPVAKKPGPSEKPAVPAAPPVQQPPAVDPAVMAQLTQQLDQLSARASAVDSSLDTLKRQQQAAGYGLRGDMATAQNLMQTYLGRAQEALQNNDPAAAQKYLDMAEVQTAKLEKFLGR